MGQQNTKNYITVGDRQGTVTIIKNKSRKISEDRYNGVLIWDKDSPELFYSGLFDVVPDMTHNKKKRNKIILIEGANLLFSEEYCYNGYYQNNIPHGKNGKLYLKKINKIKYVGEFENGVFSGKGILYNCENNLFECRPSYSGEFANGKFCGQGTKYDDDGKVIYKGSFASGKYHGPGALYDDNIRSPTQGTFVYGNLINSDLDNIG